MSVLIEQLYINSPVAKAMLALLPHMTPPVILQPGPTSRVPQGCLYLPTMRLVVAGVAGPVGPALSVLDGLALNLSLDVLAVSIRANHPTNAIRFDTVLVEGQRTEILEDLLFWTLPGRMPAFVPVACHAPAAVLGKTMLIPSEQMPYDTRAERAVGVARGSAEQQVSLWGLE